MHSLLQSSLTGLLGPDVSFWVVLGGDLLALAHIPSVLSRREGRPIAALAWILGLIAVPYGGVVLWWFLGRTHLHRPVMRRRRSQFRFRKTSRFRAHDQSDGPVGRSDFPFRFYPRRWSEGLFPPVRVPKPDILEDAGAFAALEEALGNAAVEIRIMFYIWKGDATGRRLRDILCERARAGVRVFVLLDGMGGRGVSGAFMNPLRSTGAQVAVFLPVRFRPWAPSLNFRNHRKLVIIDGFAAFTGGMNIADEYRSRWHDFLIRFRGEMVEHLDEVFREDWHFSTGRILPPLSSARRWKDTGALCTLVASGPDQTENRAHDGVFSLISSARKRVWLTTPYFVPGAALLSALKTAALRGVDVRILTPGASDVPFLRLASRSYHRTLLAAGMRIYEYRPQFLHAKGLVVDDDTVVIGSANMDVRSFRLNFEVVCFVRGRKFAGELATVFRRDVGRSTEVSERDVAARSRWQQRLESAAQLLAPVL